MDFYAPSLMPLYKGLEDAKDVYGDVLVTIGNMTTLDKGKIKNLQANLLRASEMMDKIINAITEGTAKLARDIRA
jgi:hypothetical protein